MSGLVLKLSPKERVLVNGAVVENGERRSRISILTPSANILRLKDAIHPDNAVTPVSRACYSVQLVLSGDIDPADAEASLAVQLHELKKVFRDIDGQSLLEEAYEAILSGNYYRCLKSLKRLLPFEKQILGHSSL